MTNSRMVRGDLAAPTTPEQFHSAPQRKERVIDKIREERDELAARCERLRQLGCGMLTEEDDEAAAVYTSWLESALAETPAVSLAHVRAEAIEGFGAWADKECPQDWFVYTRLALAKHYIERHIRQIGRQSGGEPTKADSSIDDDKVCVLNVLMNDPEKGWGVVSSGLEQDFKTGMNVFNVRFKDGSEHRISFKIEEI